MNACSEITYPLVKYTFIFKHDGVKRQRTLWRSKQYIDSYNVSGLEKIFFDDIASHISSGNVSLTAVRCGKTTFQI